MFGPELRIVGNHQTQDLSIVIVTFETEYQRAPLQSDFALIGLDLRMGSNPPDRHR